ncbi:MAG TPA: hypothetical protein VFT50_01825 [Baekduia sp.]|nr:hypothetical protein [Baekduia sp.]
MSSVALLVLVFGLAAALRHGGSRADHSSVASEPRILETATADVQRLIDEVQDGMTVRMVLGPDAHMTAARPVPAFGGVAYVITGDKGWCLVAPDDALDSRSDPARHGAITCQTLAMTYRFGIPLIVGHSAIAVIPQGVPAPTVTAPDGAIRRLTPSEQGVVLVDNGQPGSKLSLYARDGDSISLHFT